MSPESRERWTLAVDFGTSFTAAAIRTGSQVEVVEIDGARRFPSAVFLAADGHVLVGEIAENQAATAPERFERTPKAYLEVGEPSIPLADRLVRVVDVVGRVLNVVWQEALRQHARIPPAQVRLTHPASWSSGRQDLLREAAQVAGMPEPDFLPEPEAAAIYLSSERVTGEPIHDGACVAVYDLGGGTLDTAVLRRAKDRFKLLGEPGGDEGIGGELFDDRLYRRLCESGLDESVREMLQGSPDREWRRANHELRRQVRHAKEAVSRTASYQLYVPPPVSRELQVTREEFEELIRDDLTATLDILADTIRSAGVHGSELAAIYLVGGSARIPLVPRLVRERFGRADFRGDPKAVVALGAARVGLDRGSEPEPPPKQPAVGLGQRLASWWLRRRSEWTSALRRTRLRVALPLAILVGAGATAGALLLLDADSGPAERLKQHIPATFRETCQSRESRSKVVSVGMSCSVPESGVRVVYLQYTGKRVMNDRYDQRHAKVQNGELGECMSDVLGGLRWPVFNRWAHGRVTCTVDSQGHTLAWTDERLNIYSEATGGLLDARHLRRGWAKDEFGPVE